MILNSNFFYINILCFSPNKTLIQAIDEIYRIRSHLMAHKLFESRSRQSVVSEDSMKERGRERSERDRESGETDTDEETLEGTVMILSFWTDRSGENSADSV